MSVGTKSVLFGVHCFLIHPVLLAIAWTKLFGFPVDPRLWVAFFVHDLGYLGKPNMDGPEGERHPYFGAKIMRIFGDDWYWFTLLHSRYLAKQLGRQPSRLAIADKLVIAIEPSWLYLPRAILSGEIRDYYEQAVKCEPQNGSTTEIRVALRMIKAGGWNRNPFVWHDGVRRYMRIWVDMHKSGAVDLMTSANRGN